MNNDNNNNNNMTKNILIKSVKLNIRLLRACYKLIPENQHYYRADFQVFYYYKNKEISMTLNNKVIYNNRVMKNKIKELNILELNFIIERITIILEHHLT